VVYTTAVCETQSLVACVTAAGAGAAAVADAATATAAVAAF
jgi:hypothetical protein